jgi:ferredoxin
MNDSGRVADLIEICRLFSTIVRMCRDVHFACFPLPLVRVVNYQEFSIYDIRDPWLLRTEASQHPVILMADGIGITPFISLLESIPDDNPMKTWLLYSNRNSQAHAFRSRMAFHAARLPGLKVSNHYTSPLPSDILGRDFDSPDRITAAVVPEDLIARRARIYICGPTGMMKAFADGLIARGVPKFDIFQELFAAPTGSLADDGKTYTIAFSRSRGKATVWTSTNGAILNFAESEGLSSPSGCRIGECESCALHIVSGSVRYLNGVESDDPSICLTCSAVPTSNLVLDA